MSETKPVAWMLSDPDGDLASRVTISDQPEIKEAITENGLLVTPLYPASALTSLMEENERLKQAVAYESGDPLALKAHEALFARVHAAEARAQAAEQEIERLLMFGGRMANACYNVGQRASLITADRQDLKRSQEEWDDAAKVSRRFIKEAGE